MRVERGEGGEGGERRVRQLISMQGLLTWLN